MDSDKNNTTPVPFDVFKQTLFWPRRSIVGIEYERLMLMLRYFSICFHIPRCLIGMFPLTVTPFVFIPAERYLTLNLPSFWVGLFH